MKRQIEQITYETIATSLRESANSLLEEKEIDEILNLEKKRFENANALQISSNQIVGNNVQRYIKDLLRSKQPCFMIYQLISFLSELSIFLLFTDLIHAGICYNLGNKTSFTEPLPITQILVVLMGLLLYKYLWAMQKNKLLLDTTITISKLKHRKNSIITICFLCVSLTEVLLWFFLPENFGKLTLFQIFMGYVLCILLAGIHNIIFDSHIVSFFALGIHILTRKKPEITAQSAAKYINLRIQQLLDIKNCNEVTSINPDTIQLTKNKLRSNMITTRVYTALAVFILSILDIICIRQIMLNVTFPILLFFILVLLGTFVILTAWISANYVIKHM